MRATVAGNYLERAAAADAGQSPFRAGRRWGRERAAGSEGTPRPQPNHPIVSKTSTYFAKAGTIYSLGANLGSLYSNIGMHPIQNATYSKVVFIVVEGATLYASHYGRGKSSI